MLIIITLFFLASVKAGAAFSASSQGLSFIAKFEGCRLKAYKCPAGVWTIGYGNTSHAGAGKIITAEIAEVYLIEDSRKFERYVAKSSQRELSQNEFDALTSFAFNLGYRIEGELRRQINAREAAAAESIKKYCKARIGGKLIELKGLVRRRNAESRLYLEGFY